MNHAEPNLRLLVRAGSHSCALRLADVIETMRPLPVEPLSGAPAGVLGMAVIRGTPVPVVDLALLLEDRAQRTPTRFICIRAGRRSVAVAVDAVLGIREIPAALLSGMPPLLRDARPDVIEAIGTLDTELFLVLKSARLMHADEAVPA